MPALGETVAALARRRKAVAALGPSSRRLVRTAEFGLNPGGLRMLTYTPSNLAPDAALVVVLHGCTQTAESYAEGAGWLEAADRMGFVVLCPEQDRANNPNLCFNWFQHDDTTRGLGEAASIRQMILAASSAHRLDPSRVFITGLSAGGAMANAMLATYPEMFAAGAIIAGLPYGSASNVGEAFQAMSGQGRRSGPDWGSKVRNASDHRGPWPRVSIWQGDQDYTVRAEVADAVAAQWIDVHQAAKGAQAPAIERCDSQSWRSADGDIVVELHRISGMGHGTALRTSGDDACGSAGPFLLDVGVSSTMELVRSWGLQSGERPDSAPKTAEAAPSSRLKTSAPSRRAALDVGEVISNALKTAGLMR